MSPAPFTQNTQIIQIKKSRLSSGWLRGSPGFAQAWLWSTHRERNSQILVIKKKKQGAQSTAVEYKISRNSFVPYVSLEWKEPGSL